MGVPMRGPCESPGRVDAASGDFLELLWKQWDPLQKLSGVSAGMLGRPVGAWLGSEQFWYFIVYPQGCVGA